MYGYCSVESESYSKKKSGRLQHGLCAVTGQADGLSPVSVVPLPRLAHGVHVDAGYDGAPEHAVVGVALRTVASLVVPAGAPPRATRPAGVHMQTCQPRAPARLWPRGAAPYECR